MSTQTTGLVLLAVGGTLLWSPWALVLAGLLLIVVPDVVALVLRHRQRAAARAAFLTAQGVTDHRGGPTVIGHAAAVKPS